MESLLRKLKHIAQDTQLFCDYNLNKRASDTEVFLLHMLFAEITGTE